MRLFIEAGMLVQLWLLSPAYGQSTETGKAPHSDYELLKVILEGATALGTLIAAGSLFFLKRSLDEQKKSLDEQKKSIDLQTRSLDAQTEALREQRNSLELDYKWRRTTAAIELMRDWNEKVTPHRDTVVELGRKLYGASEGTDFIRPIRDNESDLLWNAISDSADEKERMRARINTSLLSLLNYFEYLSSAILNGSVEQEIIKTSFEDPMKRWHKCLRQYIDYVDDKTGRMDKNPVTWKPYCELMSKWEKESTRSPSAPAFPLDVHH